MKGKKDSDGVIMSKFSLNDLIRYCPDFVNEPSMMQYIGEENLGILVDRSPKLEKGLNIVGYVQRDGTIRNPAV